MAQYHFEIDGVVEASETIPYGQEGKRFLQVRMQIGTSEYPKTIPVNFFGDDAKALHGNVLQGEKLKVAGFLGSRAKEYNGKTYYNVGLTGKDVTKISEPVSAPEPQPIDVPF